MKFFQETKGAISIFLVIILVPMMTISALFVDASKVELAEGVAASAGDLTLNTALTNYDTQLKDMYGLFATAQDMDELFAKLEDYYRTCIISSGVGAAEADGYVDQIMAELGLVAGDDNTSDILNMQVVDFEISKHTDATLANSTIIDKQVVEFMKYRAPINTGLSFIAALESFTTLSKQNQLVEKRQEYYEAQEDVMKSAQQAWKYINDYNKADFVSSENYFKEMKNIFDNSESIYKKIAKKIITDLYDTQAYGTFNAKNYSFVKEKTELPDGSTKTIPILYTNSSKTLREKNYTEYTTYSDTNQATAADIKTALKKYDKAYKAYKDAEAALLKYDSNTYGLQYLVQTNRDSLYDKWVESMVTLYKAYCNLRHAATYSAKNADGSSVMETSEKLFGSSSAKPYSEYYRDFTGGFNELADDFSRKLSNYNSLLQRYDGNSDVSNTATSQEISSLYNQLNGYKTTLSDAEEDLRFAIKYLEDVLKGVKDGGTLDNRKAEWSAIAKDLDLANTSMAKQDLAELESAATYLNEKDVQKLIDRLTKIQKALKQVIEQMDTYSFFGTPIVKIEDYDDFTKLLKNKIGDSDLKHVPLNKTRLFNQANKWCDGQFVVGKKIDLSWVNNSNSSPNLAGKGANKLNFYTYLYEHFYSPETADKKAEDKTPKSSEEQLYDDIKGSASESAKSTAKAAAKGNIKSENELSKLKNSPSSKAKDGASTPSANITTGDTAAKDTGDSLSGMFDSLASSVINMSIDLRDNLYVADYVLSMFSYDTIEKELEVKNRDATESGKKVIDAVPMTLTRNQMSAKTNFAYGKEVEYIIYGGTNAENLTKAYGSIYGIRFGFNLIYAFSDSAIRDTAFAIATPISAASMGVIPAQLIQAAIIVGIACCESALDLDDMRKGESVPLFKNTQTWKTTVKSLVTQSNPQIGEALIEVGEYGIDKGLEQLNNLLDMTEEELAAFVQGGTDEVEDAINASIETLVLRHANTVVQKLTTLCTNAYEEQLINPNLDTVSYVYTGLEKWLEEEAMTTDPSSDLSYIVKKEALNLITEEDIRLIINVLQNSSKTDQGSITALTNELTEIIDSIRTHIVDEIIGYSLSVQKYKDELLAGINNSLNSGAESLKETLNAKINSMFGSNKAGSDPTGMASLLSFSYSDYLRLFLMIGLYTDKEAVLLRTADAIQANMIIKSGNKDYLLSDSSMYVQLNTTIQVKPTLLALPLFSDVEGNPSNKQGWYTFQYNLTKGY